MSVALSLGHFIKVLLDFILPFATFWNAENKLANPSSEGINQQIRQFENSVVSKDLNQVAFYLYTDPR